jgi:hypothetical protein
VKHVTDHSLEEVAERPFPRTNIRKKDTITFDNLGLQVTPSPSAALSTPETETPNEEPVTQVTSLHTNLNIDRKAETRDSVDSPVADESVSRVISDRLLVSVSINRVPPLGLWFARE